MEVAGHIDTSRALEHFRVPALPVAVAASGEIKISRTVGIQLHGGLYHLAAAVPLTRRGNQQAKIGSHRGIQRIERQGPLRLDAEGDHLLAEEIDRRQRVVAERMGSSQIHGALGGRQSAVQRVGPGIEALRKFAAIDHGQHGPAIGMIRSLADGAFENLSNCRVFFGRDAREIAEGAEHGLVRGQLIFTLAAQRLAHAARQNAVLIGDGGDDARNEVILQRENLSGLKVAFIVLGPEVSAAGRIDKLHGEAQLGSRLAEAALHHVAGAQFLTDGTHIDRLIGVTRSRTASDHLEIRKA